MAKEFKDFTFNGRSLSSVGGNYISVQFDDGDEIPLSLSRSAVEGETNRYRTEPNHFYYQWDNKLTITLDIMKDPCVSANQDDLLISRDEIRDFTRWLTSSHLPAYLSFEYDNTVADDIRYFGFFNDIATWTVGGRVYGLRLSFTCTTPFAITNEKISSVNCSGYSTLTVVNNSDSISDYVYPAIDITPNGDGEIFIYNQSDSTVLETGNLVASQSFFDALLDKVDAYALNHGYKVEYVCADTESAYNIVPLCDSTAVQFYLVDVYGNKTKCTAFFTNDTKVYRIVNGGFMSMKVYSGLNVRMDCRNLTIMDSIGRMVTYDKLGIHDADHVYWLRLINGNNAIMLHGSARFSVRHVEERKVGAV